MSYILSVIVLVFELVASAALHKLRHFTLAKRFGVLALQCMIGFGSTTWFKKIRETEHGVKWILLSDYVHMVRMYALGRAGRKTTSRKGELTQAEQAR